jgi:hypothetical protein
VVAIKQVRVLPVPQKEGEMDYLVVWGDTLSAFVEEVNNYLAEGWTPIGGISSGDVAFYQALIRNKKP